VSGPAVQRAVQRCLAESGPDGLLPAGAGSGPAPGGVTVAGIGTTAGRALGGSLLRSALTAAGLDPVRTEAFDDPAALVADPRWQLALVLSPWKQQVGSCADSLSPSAQETGVIDTLVRHATGTRGVNTNAWAAQAALETLMGGLRPDRVLVLGAGGSSYSVALAARRAWPGVELLGTARDPDALARWAAVTGATAVAPADLVGHVGAEGPALMVNTTTWGETDASESSPFSFPFDDLTAPGNRFFDLNNRMSSLQGAALAAGMSVMSGTFMQRVTNACRVALLQRVAR